MANNVKIFITIFVSLSFFSLISCTCMILLIICKKRLKSTPVLSLAQFVAISELISSFGNILSINKLMRNQNSFVCDVQGVILNYTDYSSLLWMCVISFTIWEVMTKHDFRIQERKIKYIMIGFVTPLIFTLIQTIYFYTSNEYKPTSEECWCWIYDMNSNRTVVLILYIFYWIFIFINLFFVLKSITFLKEHIDAQNDENGKRIKKTVKKLYLYLFIMILSYVFATIHRLYQLFIKKESENLSYFNLEFVLYFLHGSLNGIRGCLFLLIYALDPKVKKEIKIICSNTFSFCKKKETMQRLIEEDCSRENS